MSLSRLALLVVTAVATLLLATVFLLPSHDANAQAGPSVKLAATPFTFTKIFEGPNVVLETDPSTYTGMLDQDDDLTVAGVFRLIRKNAPPGEKTVFVNITLAICGHDGVIVLHSKDFMADGSFAGETRNPQPIIARPSTAAQAAYISLCASGTKPTPIDRSYKAPDRYTKFWS